MRAPVPWAPTCVQPPICCSVTELKFSRVSPCFASSSRIVDTRAPACTVMVRSLVFTLKTLSSCAIESMPRPSSARPLGDRLEPSGRSFCLALSAQATMPCSSDMCSGENTFRAMVEWVPLQFAIATSCSGSRGARSLRPASVYSSPPPASPTATAEITTALSAWLAGPEAAVTQGLSWTWRSRGSLLPCSGWPAAAAVRAALAQWCTLRRHRPGHILPQSVAAAARG
mmetsp:Transcript_81256/g.218368  ORF Transcript_81256/g.218368 Transcript_81256/m.218368 type:complete len:228 (+) Transcript_81256:1110-1793(+)